MNYEQILSFGYNNYIRVPFLTTHIISFPLRTDISVSNENQVETEVFVDSKNVNLLLIFRVLILLFFYAIGNSIHFLFPYTKFLFIDPIQAVAVRNI